MDWEKPSKKSAPAYGSGHSPGDLLSVLGDRAVVMGFCPFFSTCPRNRKHTGGPSIDFLPPLLHPEAREDVTPPPTTVTPSPSPPVVSVLSG